MLTSHVVDFQLLAELSDLTMQERREEEQKQLLEQTLHELDDKVKQRRAETDRLNDLSMYTPRFKN